MRPDGPITDLTEAQKRMAQIAGIPADRPGLLAEYPKMVYRSGSNPRHKLENVDIPMGNGPLVHADRLSKGYDSETALVDDPEDEAEALANGWYLTLDPKAQLAEAEKRVVDIAKDVEIAELRAQLAAQAERRGPGRPAKTE